MPRIAIYGPGGFGRELVSVAEDVTGNARLLSSETVETSLVFVSDSRSEIGQRILGLPVLSLAELPDDYVVAIGVGDAAIRRELAQRVVDRGLGIADLVAHTHRRGHDVTVGEGAVFCDFTMVTASARIGRHFHCNIYSYVAHDCVIGDFVTFAPRVCCNGNVHVEDDAYVGAGAMLRQGQPGKPLRIGQGAVVGMGAVVTRDVPSGVTVVGNPARIVEMGTER